MRRKRIRKRIAPIFEPHYIGDKAAQDHISSLIDAVWIPALRELTTPSGHELMELDAPNQRRVTQEAHGWRNKVNVFPDEYHTELMDEYLRRLKKLFPERWKK
jgi:hypothetical protein